jgi:hypothetical protein
MDYNNAGLKVHHDIFEKGKFAQQSYGETLHTTLET